MKQQINLFQSMFRPQKKPLSSNFMLMAIFCFVVFLSAIYALKNHTVEGLENELGIVSNEVDSLIKQVDALAGQSPVEGKSRLLESEIARISTELERRREIDKALARHSINNKRVFSEVLTSLARQHVEGTWLTEVSISERGEALGFAGKTYFSELVPVYIQRLSGESSFKGLSFNVLELNRSSEEQSSLNFLVSTRREKF